MKQLTLNLTRTAEPGDDGTFDYWLTVEIICDCGASLSVKQPWLHSTWSMTCAQCGKRHKLVGLPIPNAKPMPEEDV